MSYDYWEDNLQKLFNTVNIEILQQEEIFPVTLKNSEKQDNNNKMFIGFSLKEVISFPLPWSQLISFL